jgi:hypothetical protein
MNSTMKFSDEIENILEKIDEKVGKAADESLLRSIHEKTSYFARNLEDSSWAFSYLRKVADITQPPKKENGKVKNCILGITGYLSENWGDANNPNFGTIDVGILETRIKEAAKALHELNGKTVEAILFWRNDIEKRCSTLNDFKDLMTQEDMKGILEIQRRLPARFVTIEGIADLTRRNKEKLEQESKKWKDLVGSLEHAESKLTSDALRAEYDITEETVPILKRLVKGETVSLKAISKHILSDLKESKRLDERIRLKYVSAET